MQPSIRIAFAALVVLLITAIAGNAYGLRRYRARTAELTASNLELASTTRRLAATEYELASTTARAADAEESLRVEQKKNASFQGQLDKLSSTVGALDKLSKTDPELLAKYSKVYFLSDNYVPARLTDIPSGYVSPAAARTPLSFHADALAFLESMLDAAREDGVQLQVVSAYRSFGTQAQLKSGYKVTYGTGANAFSADQGYSEHQLGTTVDLTDPATGGTFTGFDATTAYAWLNENAYRYGFVLSYPQGNAYYQYEPWHWRFVGTKLARMLRNEHQRFYELDQRAIDAYLGGLFD